MLETFGRMKAYKKQFGYVLLGKCDMCSEKVRHIVENVQNEVQVTPSLQILMFTNDYDSIIILNLKIGHSSLISVPITEEK